MISGDVQPTIRKDLLERLGSFPFNLWNYDRLILVELTAVDCQ
jgi:hypothetical protein